MKNENRLYSGRAMWVAHLFLPPSQLLIFLSQYYPQPPHNNPVVEKTLENSPANTKRQGGCPIYSMVRRKKGLGGRRKDSKFDKGRKAAVSGLHIITSQCLAQQSAQSLLLK